jgi:NADPH2:quinone reductase
LKLILGIEMKEKPIQFLPNKMRFVGLTTPGGPNNLSIMAAPIPLPTDTELLIKVHASGVNGADLREREGMYPVPAGAPDIMGLEVAGEVIVVGKSCKRFKPGDFVCALLIGGGYAEYAIAPEGQCMTIPDGVSVVDAAGLPEVFCTVWTNMMDRCQLKSGETVLVQGGTSGIGFAAITVAKAFGANVFATARNKKKCEAILRFGADWAINYRDEDFSDVVRGITDGGGVDVIIDIIGGDYLPKEVELLAHGGRLMIINLRGGKLAEVDFGHVHSKHLTITGARLRPRSIAEKSAICRSLETHVWPKFADGTIAPETHAVFSFAEAADAHRLMESSNHIGKILLTP